MSCHVSSRVPSAVAETLHCSTGSPVAAWLNVLRDSIEEYDPLVTVAITADEEKPKQERAFDEILSQLGKDIYQLDEYQRAIHPSEQGEISLSILDLFDECLCELNDNNVEKPVINGDGETGTACVEQTPIVSVLSEEDCSECESTFSDVSFLTSAPKAMDTPPPVPPRELKPLDSDSDSVSTNWSYKECNVSENVASEYDTVWHHSSGYHNSDDILRRVLLQNVSDDVSVSQLCLEAGEYEVEGGRCGVVASVGAMTPDRPCDDVYEPVHDAIVTDENIYEEIEYPYNYTDEGYSCAGSVEVESCSYSASSEGMGRESPVYVNLRDHDAYTIPADVIAWRNLLRDPFYPEDEEDEWITPEEYTAYNREQRPPFNIPRIRPRYERPVHHDPIYHEESCQESVSPAFVRRQQARRVQDWSPNSERAFDIEYIRNHDSPPLSNYNRYGGSTENLLNIRRQNQHQLPASSSGDSLDVEVREHSMPRNRKSKSMIAKVKTPAPAPRTILPRPPAEAAVVHEGTIKRTKFFAHDKKCKKNWSECYMLLTQTALVFYKDQKTYYASKIPKPPGTPPSPTAPRPELTLPLQNAHIMQCKNIHTRRFTRSLVVYVSYDQYLLQDETEEGSKRWLNRIRAVINKLGPPSTIEEDPAPTSQSSNTDLESLGRTPPVSRHKQSKQKAGGSSNEDLSDPTDSKSHVKSKLRKFFARRPTMEDVVRTGIYKDEQVFGRNLAEVCPDTSPRVPEFVVMCVKEIERTTENMCTDGLYRASGNLSQVQKIRLEVDQKNTSVIKNCPDIHVLTGSLKLFFRELKEPLIPWNVFDRVLSACSIKPKEARTREFRDIVKALPECNRDTLKFLLEHLLRVTQYREQNRMHTANLAIVFGPTLLWAPAAQAHNIAVDCIQQNHVVDILLTDYKEIFS